MNSKTQKAAEIIARRVAAVTPKGLPWGFAMARLHALEDPLMEALLAYGANGSPEAQAALLKAGEDWVRGWERAAAEWVREGRPSKLLEGPRPTAGGGFQDSNHLGNEEAA